MLQKLRNVKAFTIMELMVVIAIVAIIAAIVIPNFIKHAGKYKNSKKSEIQIEEPVKQQNEKPIKEETGRAL